MEKINNLITDKEEEIKELFKNEIEVKNYPLEEVLIIKKAIKDIPDNSKNKKRFKILFKNKLKDRKELYDGLDETLDKLLIEFKNEKLTIEEVKKTKENFYKKIAVKEETTKEGETVLQKPISDKKGE